MGRECNNEYISKAKAALPDNDISYDVSHYFQFFFKR